MNDYYIHRNSGQAVFVKEAGFFESQGGLTEAWGKAWTKISAESVDDARRIAQETLPPWVRGPVVHLLIGGVYACGPEYEGGNGGIGSVKIDEVDCAYCHRRSHKPWSNPTINEWVRVAHANSRAHGWWDAETVEINGEKVVDVMLATATVPEKLMLIVTEASEAMEDYRTGSMTAYMGGDRGNKPCGFPSELADVLIRCFDLAGALGIDLEAEVAKKHAYNVTRTHRHGGKVA